MRVLELEDVSFGCLFWVWVFVVSFLLGWFWLGMDWVDLRETVLFLFVKLRELCVPEERDIGECQCGEDLWMHFQFVASQPWCCERAINPP